jgi:hypothetical protein
MGMIHPPAEVYGGHDGGGGKGWGAGRKSKEKRVEKKKINRLFKMIFHDIINECG